MVAETMDEYVLASAEAAYNNTGEKATIGFMASGGGIKGSENTPPWMDRKCLSFPYLTGTNNINWDTAAVCISIDEEATIKVTGRFNTPVE